MKSNANFLGRILFVMAFPLVVFSCSGPSMPVSDPVLSPSPGAVQAGTTIKITCETPGAEIWYTLNSKIPARGADGSVLYKSPISVTGPLSIMAIAVKAGMESSAIVKAEYRISSGGSAGWSSSGGGSTPTPPKPPAPPPPVSTFAITTQDDGDGAAAATPNPAAAGATVTVHATPKTGFMFKAWQVISGGVTLSSLTASPATFTMPSGAVTIRAEFEPVPPGTPSLSLSMASFSSVAYGYTQPAAKSITISNTGTDTATVSGIALGGADAASFTLGGSLTPTIAAGATATFTIQPNAALGVKTHSATITATYSGGVVASDTAESDVFFTVNKAAGAAVSVPTVSGTPTSTSITVNAVSLATATGQGIEYAISTANNGTGLSAWQASTAFSGLNAGTTYYVYARSAGNGNYEAGTASVSAGISTVAVPVYTVTFRMNDGTETVHATKTVTTPSTTIDTLPTAPTRTGYTFGGWNTASGGGGATFTESTTVSASITVYAQWTVNTLTINYANGGGSGSAPSSPTSAAYGTNVTIPANTYTRGGYYFDGWTVSGTGSIAGTNPYWPGSIVTVTALSSAIASGNASITLTATWKAGAAPSIDMVSVPGGSFEMGKDLGTAATGDVTPVHTVILTGFSMGKYEVTQDQYQAVIGTNPASGYGVGGSYPVYGVSWYDALVFCNKLSMMGGYSPAYSVSGSTNPSDWGAVPTVSDSTWNAAEIVGGSNGYRLPTEAQWEYAAKGGNGTPGNYTYSGSDTIGSVAWYYDNSGYTHHTVGTLAANGLGLCDMCGNVGEWCWDRSGEYTSGTQTDPLGASSGTNRISRGGTFTSSAYSTRSVFRPSGDPSIPYNSMGIRLVRP